GGGAELAADGVAADNDFFDLVLIHAVEKRAERDLLARPLGRLKEAPEEEDEDDDDDPEKRGLDGGIQRMPPGCTPMPSACLTSWKRGVPFGNSNRGTG